MKKSTCQILLLVVFIVTGNMTSALTMPDMAVTPTETMLSSPVPLLTQVLTPTPVVLAGAGDIVDCGKDYLADDQTAAILERLVNQYPQLVIFTAGDNVQGEGKGAEYRNCFASSWGKFKERILPVPGNHDYLVNEGAAYFSYFGAAAGKPGLGYYSYDLGDWHIVALNTNCGDIACGRESQQARWLRQDLAASDKKCTLLYWHNPRWSSGPSGDQGLVSTFWRIAVEFHAELVVSGHDHHYERFALLDGDGKRSSNGVRQFIVGTGGTPLRSQWGQIKANSEVRNNTTYGVMQFNLFADHYEWKFIPVDGGKFSDAGSDTCR